MTIPHLLRNRRVQIAAGALVALAIVLLVISHGSATATPQANNGRAVNKHTLGVGVTQDSAPASTPASPGALRPDTTKAQPSAPPAAPDPAQQTVLHTITNMWQEIAANTDKHYVNTAQLTMPSVVFVNKLAGSPDKHNTMSLADKASVRYIGGKINVVVSNFKSLSNDEQMRCVAAMFIFNGAAHLNSHQARYKNGQPRVYEDILGSMQFIVTNALTKAYGAAAEPFTWAVVDEASIENVQSGSVAGYYNAARDQGPWL